jgi:hypothetical protein
VGLGVTFGRCYAQTKDRDEGCHRWRIGSSIPRSSAPPTVPLSRACGGIWPQHRCQDVTPTTRRLLEYWSDPECNNPILYKLRGLVPDGLRKQLGEAKIVVANG